jgi:hypothetical protein
MLFEPKESLLEQNFELLCLDFAFNGPFSALSSILRGNFTSSNFVLKKIFEDLFRDLSEKKMFLYTAASTWRKNMRGCVIICYFIGF